MGLKAAPRSPAYLAGLTFDIALVVLTLSVVVAVAVARIPRGSLGLRPYLDASSGSATGVSGSSASIPRDDTLEIAEGGSFQPLPVGDAFPLGRDLVGRIAVAHPNGSPYVRHLDVVLNSNAQSSSVVSDANVSATVRMVGMDMGIFGPVATPTSPGHYRLAVALPMPGEWQIDLKVTAPTDHATATLHLFVWT
jgi:hypothetical protein